MRSSFLATIAILLLVGSQSGAHAQSGFQRYAIPDPSGFEQPMTAFTIEAPAGWQARGGVFWDVANPCQEIVPSAHWQAHSPDGSQAFEVLPRWASEMTGQQGGLRFSNCPDAPLASLRAWLEYVARLRHPDGRLLDYRDRPELAAALAVPAFPEIPGSPLHTRAWAEAGEILVGWDEQGRAMREAIVAAGVITDNRVEMPLTGTSSSRKVSVLTAAALRAPDGMLDFALLARILHSMQPDPAWQSRMSRHSATMAAASANAAIERGRIRADANRQIADANTRAWQERQAASDASHARHIDAIRGVQYYQDPSAATGAVELSNQYQHAWRLQDGSHVQTDDPSFNPWTDLGTDGEELAPIQR